MATATAGSWWVGENLTNQNSFRIHNFFSNNAPSGYQAVQAGNNQDAAAFARSLASGKTTPPLHAIVWQIRGGPYDTEAEAKAAIPGIQAQTPAPGFIAQTPVGGAITDVNNFLSRLTSMNTWVRVGEFVLGALLILAGALKLSGQSSDIGDAVKLATKVVK